MGTPKLTPKWQKPCICKACPRRISRSNHILFFLADHMCSFGPFRPINMIGRLFFLLPMIHHRWWKTNKFFLACRLESGKGHRMGCTQPFAGRLQGEDFPIGPLQIAFFTNSGDKPHNVPFEGIPSPNIARSAASIEEKFIDGDSRLLPPPAQRRDLDLSLRHQPRRA